MKERPILFSGPMVRAILEGRKTQTRRVVKLRDGEWIDGDHIAFDKDGKCGVSLNGKRYPHGTVGDRLWVRESFREVSDQTGGYAYRANCSSGTEKLDKWKPSIHMPRWASRITLEITGVRVERLQDISASDCIAEGLRSEVFDQTLGFRNYMKKNDWFVHWGDGKDIEDAAIESFQSLWQSINGDESWAANPWVWVIEFRKMEA